MNSNKSLYDSLAATEGVTSTDDVLSWVQAVNENLHVDIRKTTLAGTKWLYDEQSGQIVNNSRTFFQISGLRYGQKEQPIIIQDEIGHLGILCKPIGGILHFLMQVKIEPGNVNKTQISPTVQATLSNFTQVHGGAKPPYLDYLFNASRHHIIVDQIQSEQSSRFLGKRNRNIVLRFDENEEIEELPTHKWLTLGQIKKLMQIDNLVNMDTRTVIGCLPYYRYNFGNPDTAFKRSIMTDTSPDTLNSIYNFINDVKMFDHVKPELIPLYNLKNWETAIQDGSEEFRCNDEYPFKIVFCDISIEGREVRRWGQPLFEAQGMATFGLFTRVNDGVMEFLIHAKQEVGCLDKIELGPTVQLEATDRPENDIEKLFYERYSGKKGILYDVIHSEEGGRFYCEQNRNIILEIEENLIASPPPGYWWCTYRTLSKLVQINNTLNIQLRNLLALLEITT